MSCNTCQKEENKKLLVGLLINAILFHYQYCCNLHVFLCGNSKYLKWWDCTVLYFIILHFTELYFTVLYCTVIYCTVLYCTTIYCTVYTVTLQCNILLLLPLLYRSRFSIAADWNNTNRMQAELHFECQPLLV